MNLTVRSTPSLEGTPTTAETALQANPPPSPLLPLPPPASSGGYGDSNA